MRALKFLVCVTVRIMVELTLLESSMMAWAVLGSVMLVIWGSVL